MLPSIPTGAGPSKLGIVIPARNEATRIDDVLRHIKPPIGAVEHVVVYVIDDGSSDNTAAVASAAGARVLRHRANLGKGAALATGCEAAMRDGCSIVALMDADGQHEPDDLPGLIGPIVAGEVTMTLGTRRFDKAMPVTSRIGNWGLSLAFRLFFKTRIADTQSGFRAFSANAYPQLRWLSVDYSVETEMLMNMARARLPYREVEIGTIYHDRYKGTTIADGLRIFGDMLRWTLQR